MNPWIVRIITIILAVALVPLIISWIAAFVTKVIYSVGERVQSLLDPLFHSGNTEGILTLGFGLVAITLLIRFLLRTK